MNHLGAPTESIPFVISDDVRHITLVDKQTSCATISAVAVLDRQNLGATACCSTTRLERYNQVFFESSYGAKICLNSGLVPRNGMWIDRGTLFAVNKFIA